ncbi:MAG TPA: ammonium transporter [Oceanospirillales bacterium]|nr:ammonium transporter [Oceanospirillales bacterium]
MMLYKNKLITLLLLFLLPTQLLAEETLSSGDTAWMLTATALVLLMTIPGLSLFYAGMVRSKNVLSVMMQCFAITGMMSILWVVYGYSLAFSDGGGMNSFIGGLDNFMLLKIKVDSLSGTIPETVFMTFQMTFFIITPALIVGAFAERMKFSAMLWFMAVWGTVVYLPICHWVWGGGWMSQLSTAPLDFAGGTVVHINAAVAGLVASIMVGKRKGYKRVAMAPHNLPFTLIGAALLWVGWFGFNAGSELAADGTAGMAMAVTQIATAMAALSWMFVEWLKYGKPSVLGIASGAVGGLVAITPASGSVGPTGALVIGLFAGVACYWGATSLKNKFNYDDSLDVFGVHGIGGIVGAVLTGIFVSASLGGVGLAEGVSMASQVIAQIISIAVTLVWSGLLSFIILKLIDKTIGLRVSEEAEIEGLDISSHDERGYNL